MADVKIEQEMDYWVTEDANGVLGIVIMEKDGEPFNPYVLYDNGEHALLYRNPKHVVILDYVDEEARPLLFKAEKVGIAEISKKDKETPVRVYEAPVKKVPLLPINENDMQTFDTFLMEWERQVAKAEAEAEEKAEAGAGKA